MTHFGAASQLDSMQKRCNMISFKIIYLIRSLFLLCNGKILEKSNTAGLQTRYCTLSAEKYLQSLLYRDVFISPPTIWSPPRAVSMNIYSIYDHSPDTETTSSRLAENCPNSNMPSLVISICPSYLWPIGKHTQQCPPLRYGNLIKQTVEHHLSPERNDI